MLRRLRPAAGRIALAGLLAAVTGVALAQESRADEMRYFIKNENPRAVVIELFGDETGTRWPGNDQVYLLEGGERKTVPIDCRQGERICYGAWLRGSDQVFWGVGPDNDQDCETCCAICVGKTVEEISIR